MDASEANKTVDDLREIADPLAFAMSFCEYVDTKTSPELGGDATQSELAIQMAYRWYFSLTLGGMGSALIQSDEPLDRIEDALRAIGATACAARVAEAAAAIRQVPERARSMAMTMGELSELYGPRFREVVAASSSADDGNEVLDALVRFINAHRSALLSRSEVQSVGATRLL